MLATGSGQASPMLATEAAGKHDACYNEPRQARTMPASGAGSQLDAS